MYIYPGLSLQHQILCAKKSHNCYMYNITGQELADVHDPVRLFTVEVSLLIDIKQI